MSDETEIMFSIHGPMISGISEAASREYFMFTGKSGKRWLVANQLNEGDNIYVDGGPGSQGFGGRKMQFKLVIGDVVEFEGPWHSNSDALFEDTGHDARAKHVTQGIIATNRRPVNEKSFYAGDIYSGIIHYDEKPVVGEYDRIEKMAREWAEKNNQTCHYAMKSSGGGSASTVRPKVKS